MPAINKQSLINLLIDSPLREAIKINLVDIVNNTNDQDLEKTYSTIVKELEIYQKATERRLKLAAETITQLQQPGSTTEQAPTPQEPVQESQAPQGLPAVPPMPQTPVEIPKAFPPLPPLPPLPTTPVQPIMPQPPQATQPTITEEPKLSVPPLDLPPLPTAQTQQTEVTETITQKAEPTLSDDESALQEIQKELDALKNSAASDVASTQPQTT